MKMDEMQSQNRKKNERNKIKLKLNKNWFIELHKLELYLSWNISLPLPNR